MTYRLFFSLAALSLLVPACSSNGGGGGDGDPDSGVEPEVTYWEDVKPILDAKCAGCHYDGGIAPFALTDYDLATAHSGVSLINVRDGIMPPWPPNNECDDYIAPRSLTAEQQATFEAWVEAGTPEGDPANEGDPIEVETTQISRVDAELAMTESYTPQEAPDDYRCFLLEWPEEEPTYVTGFNAVPGNLEIVHHVIAFLAAPDEVQTYRDLDAAEAGPGYTCFGGTGGPSQTMIGGWAPGGQGDNFPAGTGLPVEPGSLIVLQVHYNVLQAEPAPDETSIQVRLDSTVDREAQIIPWANPQWLSGTSMAIPANESDVMHRFSFDPTFYTGGPFLMHSATIHMHNLGTHGSLTLTKDGADDCLLQIDRWDFQWQDSYGFREPKLVEPGDQLAIECHWDNTIENQPIVDGEPLAPTDTYWGEGTTDEMCVGFFYISEP